MLFNPFGQSHLRQTDRRALSLIADSIDRRRPAVARLAPARLTEPPVISYSVGTTRPLPSNRSGAACLSPRSSKSCRRGRGRCCQRGSPGAVAAVIVAAHVGHSFGRRRSEDYVDRRSGIQFPRPDFQFGFSLSRSWSRSWPLRSVLMP